MLNTTIQPRTWLVALLGLVMLAWTGIATAQMPVPDAASQFNIDGFIQEATLDPACASSALCGGTLKVNGHTIIVPANTIVILPANAMTWQELFACAPAPYGNGYSSLTPLTCGALKSPAQTGMALADLPAPLTTYEATVTGNKAPGSAGAGDRYIAGLINIAQQGLNSGQGYITNINYTTGEIQVANPTNAAVPFVRVRINDPATAALTSGNPPVVTGFSGRYSLGNSPDPRFTVDQDNPTISAGSGFPMCLPRTAPAGGVTTDGLCPEENRPKCLGADGVTNTFCGTFTMPNPGTLPPGGFPDARVQAPFEIGDYITFAGTLVQDCAITGCPGGGPTAGPWPTAGASATYISAHTITNNIAIYTFPNTNPAYIRTDVTLLGTGGGQVLGAVEATKRTRFEGMMTDPSRMVHLYGLDLPCASTTIGACDRDWGIIGVDQGPPTGAVKGRWRFRPPCAAFGTDPATIKFDKQCIMNQAGVFDPATREVRAVIAPLGTSTLPGWIAGQVATAANGIIYGQYHAPILDLLFPEQIPGAPVPPANFEAVPFLAVGGYTSSLGTTAPGPLNPWPGSTAPCGVAPTVVAFASPSSTVFSGSGQLVTLDASGTTGGTPITFAWTQSAADTTPVTLTGANTSTATFTAPTVAAATTLHFTVTATNCSGTATGAVTVNVVVDVPLVNHVAPVTVPSGAVNQTIAVSGVDPNSLPLTFAVTQSGGAPALPSLSIVQGPNPPANTATITFSAPTLPNGTVLPDVIQLAITATNSVGAVSPTEFTTVTVNPPADVVTVTAAQYRISKQRLTINASDSMISPNIVLTLQPYTANDGTTVNPCSLGQTACVFLNQGGGLYLLDVLGLPAPLCNAVNGPLATPCAATPMTIKTNILGGGTAAPFGLTSIRQ